ncbi:MAG: hypothetical protein SGBAC_004317 [Bacillariaceae sp.]
MRLIPTILIALTAATTISADNVLGGGSNNKRSIRGAGAATTTRDLQKTGTKSSSSGGSPPTVAPAPTVAPVAAPTEAPEVAAAAAASTSTSTTAAIPSPSEIVSEDGVLSTTISIAQGTYTIPGTPFTVNARLLNGEYPGPTLRIKPGDTLEINFENNLVDTGSEYVHNEYSGNDISNIHFHGLHVSGELPSDDVTHYLYPGESYNYTSTLPDEHMGGTHWQHPHKHGSTSLQVAGGALQAIIVEDEDGFLPTVVANAREVLFIAHYWHLTELATIVSLSGDTVTSHDISGSDFNEFVTVNGQYQPVINIDAGEWIRLRVVWANYREGDLDLGISGCEMFLLAKDGIYIQDFPRSIVDAAVVSGGRADIMVRCPDPDTTYSVTGIVDLASIQTSNSTVTRPNLPTSWTPTYPEYLEDLTTETVTEGCTCDTVFSGNDAVNSIVFPEDADYLHQTYLGATTARNIVANTHPYHQHVYPFQLVGATLESGYNKVGDWHDTIKGTGEIRFRPTEFTGKMMLHCHRLIHEDLGMMAMEYVGSAALGQCSCTSVQGVAE